MLNVDVPENDAVEFFEGHAYPSASFPAAPVEVPPSGRREGPSRYTHTSQCRLLGPPAVTKMCFCTELCGVVQKLSAQLESLLSLRAQ